MNGELKQLIKIAAINKKKFLCFTYNSVDYPVISVVRLPDNRYSVAIFYSAKDVDEVINTDSHTQMLNEFYDLIKKTGWKTCNLLSGSFDRLQAG